MLTAHLFFFLFFCFFFQTPPSEVNVSKQVNIFFVRNAAANTSEPNVYDFLWDTIFTDVVTSAIVLVPL